MSYDEKTLIPLVERDRRYPMEAYRFMHDALRYAQEELNMGQDDEPLASSSLLPTAERHLTGQELCEAIRHYALKQYGFMAKTVLNRLGMYQTQDFGNVVYNLISIGQMKKGPRDRRDHFNDVYDFEVVFRQEYRFEVAE